MLTTRALIIDQARMHKASRSDLGREALVHGRQYYCGLPSWHVEAHSAELWRMMFRVRVSS
jgi:hypothetical protein